jgi:hypothetical protein
MAVLSTIKDHLKDGGFKSRKFWLVVWTQAQIVGFAACCGKWPSLATALPTVATALIAAAGLFITGNVAAKQVLGKQLDLLVSATATKDEPAKTDAPAAQ